MNRKPLALAIVLLIAGLAPPPSAIMGFCKRMPCCNHGVDRALDAGEPLLHHDHLLPVTIGELTNGASATDTVSPTRRPGHF